jgi:hypothetical protein
MRVYLMILTHMHRQVIEDHKVLKNEMDISLVECIIGQQTRTIKKGDNIPSKNYSESQTRAKVARYVSLYGKKISHATLATAEKVYDAAQQEPAIFGQIWTDLNSEKFLPIKHSKRCKEY